MCSRKGNKSCEQWFALYCKADDSYVVVDRSAIICHESVAVGDEVHFTVGKKQWLGVIKGISGDRAAMTELQDKLNTQTKPRREPSFHEDEPRRAAVRCMEGIVRRPSRTAASTSRIVLNSKSSNSKVRVQQKSNAGAKPFTDAPLAVHHGTSTLGQSSSGKQNSTLLMANVEHSSTSSSSSETSSDKGDSDGSDMSPQEMMFLEKLSKKTKFAEFKSLAAIVKKRCRTNSEKNQAGCLAKKHCSDELYAAPDISCRVDGNSVEVGDTGSVDVASTSAALNTNALECINNSGTAKAKPLKKKCRQPPQDLSQYEGAFDVSKETDSNVEQLHAAHSVVRVGATSVEVSDTGSGDVASTSAALNTNALECINNSGTAKAKPLKRKYRKPPQDLPQYEGAFYVSKETDSNVEKLHASHTVFIQSEELKKVKRQCNTRTAAARALLNKVYTKEAREACSISGKPFTNRYGEIERRPQLHQDGVEAIIDFVTKRGDSKRWPQAPTPTLKQAMANALCEERAKKRLLEEIEEN